MGDNNRKQIAVDDAPTVCETLRREKDSKVQFCSLLKVQEKFYGKSLKMRPRKSSKKMHRRDPYVVLPRKKYASIYFDASRTPELSCALI